MKTKTVWISRNSERNADYNLWSAKPKKRETVPWWEGNRHNFLCWLSPKDWQFFCPSIKVALGECIKTKLTILKNGIKLEKVK